MSESIILRTLTEKSQLKFSKYADLTVQQMLHLGHTKVLRWMYYNCSKITFTSDILPKIGVYERFMIEKPGTNQDMFELSNKYAFGSAGDEKRLRIYRRKKQVEKGKMFHSEFQNRTLYSKKSMQLKNQGK